MISIPATRALALSEATRIVLRHYLDEGELARARYRLVGSVPALRARETGGIQQYQRLFARWSGSGWPTCPTDISAPTSWRLTS